MADDTKNTQDSPVTIHEHKDTIQGQPQARASEPHDGQTLVHEVVVHTDRVILDPNDELAVQVPEGVGASTVGAAPALSALKDGTAEEQFARAPQDDSANTGPEVPAEERSIQAEEPNAEPKSSSSRSRSASKDKDN
jgi:hypothetical protein